MIAMNADNASDVGNAVIRSNRANAGDAVNTCNNRNASINSIPSKSETSEGNIKIVRADVYDRERVIAIINGKGGVMKTTLSANVGGLAAASGYKVLIVDFDPQGNLAEDLGYTETDRDDHGRALAAALAFGGSVEPVRGVRENLDVLTGGVNLEQATAALASKAAKDPNGAKLALAVLLAPLAKDYDLIIIDCPPGDETLQNAALAAARWAVVPIKSDASSRKGLAAVAHRLDAVLDINPTLDLLGVVLVGVGKSATAVQERARKLVAEAFQDDSVLFSGVVRHSEATAQATRERGLLVHELDDAVRKGPKWYEVIRGEAQAQSLAPKSSGSVADDLLAITQEMIARITAAEERVNA